MYQLAEHLGQPLSTILSMTADEFAHWFTYLKIKNQKMKERYGVNAPGQRMLLARRLVEAGVRFVSLTAGGWDHHGGNHQPELSR